MNENASDCDLNENAAYDDENSSTESVEALTDNMLPHEPKNDAKSLPQPTQKDEKTFQTNEKSSQICVDDVNENGEDDSDPCTCSHEVN